MNKKEQKIASAVTIAIAIIMFVGFSISNLPVLERAQKTQERSRDNRRTLNWGNYDSSPANEERARSFIREQLENIDINAQIDSQQLDEILSSLDFPEDIDISEIDTIIQEEINKFNLEERGGFWSSSTEGIDNQNEVQEFNTEENVNVEYTNSTSRNQFFKVKFLYTEDDGIGFEIYHEGSDVPRMIHNADPIMIRIQVNQGTVFQFRGIAVNNGTRIHPVRDRVPIINNLLSSGGNINFRISFGIEDTASSYSFELENAEAFTEVF